MLQRIYKHVCVFTKKQVKFCSFAMAQLTIEQRVLIVKYYIQTQSIAAVRDAFRARFPNRRMSHLRAQFGVMCKSTLAQAPAIIQ